MKVLAVIALAVIALAVLAGCGAPSTVICVGPETYAPDADFEDQFDTDTVRLPDDVCESSLDSRVGWVTWGSGVAVPVLYGDISPESSQLVRSHIRPRTSSPTTPATAPSRGSQSPAAPSRAFPRPSAPTTTASAPQRPSQPSVAPPSVAPKSSSPASSSKKPSG